MKIGVIQATSQKEKNELLYNCTVEAVKRHGYEVVNFGKKEIIRSAMTLPEWNPERK